MGKSVITTGRMFVLRISPVAVSADQYRRLANFSKPATSHFRAVSPPFCQARMLGGYVCLHALTSRLCKQRVVPSNTLFVRCLLVRKTAVSSTDTGVRLRTEVSPRSKVRNHDPENECALRQSVECVSAPPHRVGTGRTDPGCFNRRDADSRVDSAGPSSRLCRYARHRLRPLSGRGCRRRAGGRHRRSPAAE